jgi:hypothetical protein
MLKARPIAAYLVSSWITERCELGSTFHDCAGALLDSWRGYARAHGAEAGSPAEFAAVMEQRGYPRDQLAGDRRRIRWGLRLRVRSNG